VAGVKTSFVVQIEGAPASGPGRSSPDLAGRIENLDSGASCRFRSARELLRFLRGGVDGRSRTMDGAVGRDAAQRPPATAAASGSARARTTTERSRTR